MDLEAIKSNIMLVVNKTIDWATSPQFYAQCGMIILAIAVAYFVATILIKYIPLLRDEPKPGKLYALRKNIYQVNDLLFPLFSNK